MYKWTDALEDLETSVDFHQNTQRRISQDTKLYTQSHQHLTPHHMAHSSLDAAYNSLQSEF
jgi:hypothetical protein